MNRNDPRLGRRPMADPRHGYSPGPWISLAVGAVVLALVVAGFAYVTRLIGA
jgi:hypothetical protein